MRNAPVVLPLLLLVWLCSCKKSIHNPVSNLIELKGSVLLFDEGNNKIDKSGMKVRIENTNPVISSMTDANGNFSLNVDPSLSSFGLVYSKKGFGTFKRYYIRANDGRLYALDLANRKKMYYNNELKPEELGSSSTATINSFKANIENGTVNLLINVSSPNASGIKYVRVLAQKDLPDISINTVDKSNTSSWSYVTAVKYGENAFSFCLKCSSLCFDWKSGDRIYLTAYGESLYSNIYFDPSSNSFVLPNLNQTEIAPVSLVVP